MVVHIGRLYSFLEKGPLSSLPVVCDGKEYHYSLPHLTLSQMSRKFVVRCCRRPNFVITKERFPHTDIVCGSSATMTPSTIPIHMARMRLSTAGAPLSIPLFHFSFRQAQPKSEFMSNEFAIKSS